MATSFRLGRVPKEIREQWKAEGHKKAEMRRNLQAAESYFGKRCSLHHDFDDCETAQRVKAAVTQIAYDIDDINLIVQNTEG